MVDGEYKINMNGVSEIFMSTKLYTLSKQRGTFHTTADALLLSRLHGRRLLAQDQGTDASPFAAVIGRRT